MTGGNRIDITQLLLDKDPAYSDRAHGHEPDRRPVAFARYADDSVVHCAS